MKDTVVLVQPRQYQGEKQICYPLASLALAATLREEKFNPIILIADLYPDYLERLKEYLPHALLVGISVLSKEAQINNSLEISDFIHRFDPKIPVVWGGWHPTCAPAEALAHKNVDIVVRGEGDETLVHLAKVLQANGPLSQVKGVGYKVNGEMIHTPTADLISDLNTLPLLPWDLIDVMAILRNNERSFLEYQVGRGCAMNCTFCGHKVVFPGKNHRTFSAQHILDDIEPIIRKFNIDYVNFYEGTTLHSRARVRELCDEILKRKLNFAWEASSRANVFPYLGDDSYELLKKSGCQKINFGFESGSPYILNRILKKEKISEMVKTVALSKRYGFAMDIYFISNLYFERMRDTFMTLLFMLYLRLIQPSPMVSLLVLPYIPFPGTKIEEEYQREKKTPGKLQGLKRRIMAKILRRAELFLNRKRVKKGLPCMIFPGAKIKEG